ncbi:MAG: hypothetical protein OXB88_11405 [Bacteriovoracales bacterium]|nr:hypothetical protein [Bacteriovoracales bacterium]
MLRLSFIFFALGLISLTVNHFKRKEINPFDLGRYQMAESSYFPLSVHCDEAKTGFLEFHGRAITHGDFLPKSPREVVRDQLKYIDGFVDHSDHSKTRFVPHLKKDFEILKVQKISYPVEVYLNKVGVNPSFYPEKTLERWYRKGARATEVTYKAKVKVTRCREAQDHHDLILPLDPYLAYWYVPKDKWVETTYESPSTKITATPCAHEMIALVKEPSQYWNVWKPQAKKCLGLLKENLHTGLFKGTFIPEEKKSKRIEFSHLAHEKDEIHISFISGLLESEKTQKNLKKIRTVLDDLNAIDKIDKEKQKDQDTATLATLTFMHLMKKLARHTHWTAKDLKDHFIIESKGKLLHSKKPITIQIYLGPTVGYPEGRLHWPFLSNALKKSDFIFYTGHAALGWSFTLENLKENSDFKTFENTPDHQFIAVLSCSSISYFGEDFIKERKLAGKTTDFLRTGFDDNSYLIVPAMIQYIDLELAGKHYSLESILKSHLLPNYDIHLTRN